MGYDAILFDFDGVLADTEAIHFECWNEILAPYGIRLTWEHYCRSCIGIADRTMIEFLAGQADPPLDPDRLFAEYPAKKALFRERVLTQPPVYTETIDLVKALNIYGLAVVTSSGRLEVEPVLTAAGLRPYFRAAVFGDDVIRHKPSPEPYLRAAELLNARCPLVVEDSDAGAASGRAAGFDVLRVASAMEVPERVRLALASGRI
ncbi:MAG: HAD family hydrolase [Bryobacteraceae bacterium]